MAVYMRGAKNHARILSSIGDTDSVIRITVRRVKVENKDDTSSIKHHNFVRLMFCTDKTLKGSNTVLATKQCFFV